MDEGLPIAYLVLEKNVPVYADDGTQIGTVDHVVAATDVDIFHGVVIDTNGGKRFVAAEYVRELHERGVDLEIDVVTASELPTPDGGAPAYRVNEPGVKPSEWRHLFGYFTPKGDRSSWKQLD